jgi:DNA recombination protein RmuC
MNTAVLSLLIVLVLLTAITCVAALRPTRGGQEGISLLTPLQALTQNIGVLQADLRGLNERVTVRQQLDQQTADSIRRLETIIAGTQTKGLAGENLVELVFSQLPAEWQVRNFQIGNRVVEFGLRLPNKLVVPIDSKWPATSLIEQLAETTDAERRRALKKDIERVVVAKVREVEKYVRPDLTLNFAIAAVPDAVFDLCSGAQVEALRSNVVIVAYSMLVPYLLLTFQTVLRTSQNLDVQRLVDYLADVEKSLSVIGDELEGRFAKAVTMLENSGQELRREIATVKTGLASVGVLAPQKEQASQSTGAVSPPGPVLGESAPGSIWHVESQRL